MKTQNLRLLALSIMLLLFAGDICGKGKTQSSLLYYQKIDSLINHAEEYELLLKNEIKQMKHHLCLARDDGERYVYAKAVYGRYLTYVKDSAYLYLEKCLQLGRANMRQDWINQTLIDKAYLYTVNGLFALADSCLQVVEPDLTAKDEKLNYYVTRIFYLTHWADFTKSVNKEALRQACDSIMSLDTVTNSPYRLWAVYWRENGDYTESFRRYLTALYEDFLKTCEPDDPWYGKMTIVLSLLYSSLGDREHALQYAAYSCMRDIVHQNRDIPSLRMMALKALEDGQLDYAVNFINYCIGFQSEYPDQTKSVQIGQTLADVYYLQRKTLIQEQTTAYTYMWISIIACILLFLGCIVIFLLGYKQYGIKKQLQRKNQELTGQMKQVDQLNAQLQESAKQLQQVNNKIKMLNSSLLEANYVKEEYIGLLFTFCSNYINKIEEMRKDVFLRIKNRQYAELYRDFSPSVMRMEHEIQDLYKYFDATFLKIYPNFITDFNSLLQPDKQVQLKNEELLNTELRIYALVYLGIVKSTQIAEFLHLSTQTVYNARLKMRSRATSSEQSFVERVCRLGNVRKMIPDEVIKEEDI